VCGDLSKEVLNTFNNILLMLGDAIARIDADGPIADDVIYECYSNKDWHRERQK
jgi:hypothetical protein